MSTENQGDSSGFLGCLAVTFVCIIIVGLIVGILSGDRDKGIRGATSVGRNIIAFLVGIIGIFEFMWLISKK